MNEVRRIGGVILQGEVSQSKPRSIHSQKNQVFATQSILYRGIRAYKGHVFEL